MKPHRLIFNLVSKIRLFIPLIRDFISGKYRKIPFSSIIGIILAVVYIVSPYDLVMDFIPFWGQIDDILILFSVIFALDYDLEKYKKWKDDEKKKKIEDKK